jgi:pimeloyl-ACP methyl ester carboxylesterase
LPTGEQRIAKHLRSLGTEVTFSETPGYSAMMREPEQSIVPVETLETIVDWIRTPRGPVATVPSRQSTTSPSLIARSGASRKPVREIPHYFGEGGRLFGILTEPVGDPPDPARPAIIFLNVGANHRIGPNRMYVSLARDFAALGYLAFRFDVAGLGDSVADGGGEYKIYSRESVHDVKAAVSLLSSMRGTRRVVLVGVCSGAYLAFHTGLADERVAGEILINPQTFEWKDDDTLELSTRKSFRSTRYYLNALTKRKVWGQAMRGKVDARSVVGVLRERLVARLGAGLEEAIGRFSGELLPRSEIARAFHTMSDRGVESLLVFSSNDGGLDMIERHLGRDAKKIGRKNVRLEIIEDADHTFTLVRWQTELATLMTSFIEKAFP